ncbi:histidinol-phosphate transaminase [Leucobacter weissii]|uniref:Aromatic amino acid aminotransferase n=1 Tax=Leucobacter weissii TaxID=1983706 RepID=A0A939MIV5_9MICO|nr:histidinol-phosphate transaminase [Leucobacter weissii]MBO1901396.1 histidinol-phosphate transaminase [Leucobacter weissii]
MARPLEEPGEVRGRPGIEDLPVYVQGKSAPDAVKLSSNENPYPPLGPVLDVVREEAARINRYPDMGAVELRGRIAAHHGVRADEIAVGTGSVEVAQQLVNASAGPGDEVVFAWRSFEAYPILVRIAGATPVMVPLAPDERHDLDAMAAAITPRTRLVLICTPNNPTGAVVRTEEFERFLAAVPRDVLVVVDEAYVHFDRDPDSIDGVDLFRRHPNVAVLHTFSKAYGLAGLRVGYAIAPERIATNLRRVAVPFGVSGLAQAAAAASLDAESALAERVDLVVSERARVLAAVRDRGWRPVESSGNFVWLRTGARTDAVGEALRGGGVLVRAFSGEGLRITIGTPEMNERLLAALPSA